MKLQYHNLLSAWSHFVAIKTSPKLLQVQIDHKLDFNNNRTYDFEIRLVNQIGLNVIEQGASGGCHERQSNHVINKHFGFNLPPAPVCKLPGSKRIAPE